MDPFEPVGKGDFPIVESLRHSFFEPETSTAGCLELRESVSLARDSHIGSSVSPRDLQESLSKMPIVWSSMPYIYIHHYGISIVAFCRYTLSLTTSLRATFQSTQMCVLRRCHVRNRCNACRSTLGSVCWHLHLEGPSESKGLKCSKIAKNGPK